MGKPYVFLIIMGLVTILPIASLAEENNLPMGKNYNLALNGGDSVTNNNGDEEILKRYSPTKFEGKARKPWRNQNHPPPLKAPTNQGPPTSGGGSGGDKSKN